MKYDDLVGEFYIDSYFDLLRMIDGSVNLKKNCIFRGMSNVDYKLTPMALRKDNFENPIINNYIGADFYVTCSKSANELFDNLKISFEEYTEINENELCKLRFNKYGEVDYNIKRNSPMVSSEWQLQIKRELHVLNKFLELVNNSGFDISDYGYIKKLIQDDLKNPLDKWPNSNFFEIMALAQHYGLPTQAIGWSDDYKVALYYAVRNVLENDCHDGVLWAFNHESWENHGCYKLCLHRPKYCPHPDLKAQKTLFSFIVNDEFNFDHRSFDEIIVGEFIESSIESGHQNNDKLFYKFIIPNEIKHEILHELYLDGYGEEFLFPGYGGVASAIKNQVKLNDHMNKLDAPFKRSVLKSFSDEEIKKIIHNDKKIIFNKASIAPMNIRVFIYSQDSKSVIGYFDDCLVFKDTVENIWMRFKNNSALSIHDFNNLFKNQRHAFAIKLTGLRLFKYPVNLSYFKFTQEYYDILNDESIRFLLNFAE